MLDLMKYGLEAQWPQLRSHQQEVSALEQRRAEAERAVVTARQGVEEAKQQDNEHAAKALRAGKDMPPAKHEAKATAQLEAAERTLTAFGKALEGAQSDLARFTARHSGQIHAAIVEALRVKAERLAEHAREAAVLYGMIEDSRYDLRQFTPATPRPETGPPGTERGRDSTAVIALQTTRSAGPARGDVEQMLRYLAGLESQFAAPGEPSGEAEGNAA